jgi:hypothetical protein
VDYYNASLEVEKITGKRLFKTRTVLDHRGSLADLRRAKRR